MVPNARLVAARSLWTDAPLFGISLASALQGFWRIIWAHVTGGLDENAGMDRKTDLIFYTFCRCGFTTFDRSIR